MGYVPHAELQEPSDDTKLWRYMDLGKYLDLLSTSSLAMPKASVMRDPYEGEIGSYSRQIPVKPLPGMSADDAATMASLYNSARSAFRDFTYLSCWHAAENESAGMWSLYADENKGVALITTWGELKASTRTDVPMFGGRVKYVDYESYRVPELQVTTVYCHKRISFQHEREVRLFVQDRQAALQGIEVPEKWTTHPDGMDPVQHPEFLNAQASGAFRLSADLGTLIDEVKVSPSADPWFVRVVQDVSRKYGGQWEVTQSDLYRLH